MSSVAQIDKFTLQDQLCWSQESQGTTIESRSWNGMMELGKVPWRSHICRICGLGTSNLESWNNFKKHQMWSKNRTTQSLSWWRILCGSQGKNDRLWKCRFLVCPQLLRVEWFPRCKLVRTFILSTEAHFSIVFPPCWILFNLCPILANIHKHDPELLQSHFSIAFFDKMNHKNNHSCVLIHIPVYPPPQGSLDNSKWKKWI